MKNFHLYSMFCVLVLLSNCKSEPDPIIENQKEDKMQSIPVVPPNGIIGTWEWESNSLGITGKVETPESEGYTLQLSLKDDGSYVKYKDYLNESEGTYHLKDTMLDGIGSVTYFNFDDKRFWSCGLISLNADSNVLYIGGRPVCSDAISTCYNRIK